MLPSLSAEKFIEDVHNRVGAKTKAVLGRSAVALALAEGVRPEYKPPAGNGKDISWDALVGPLEETFRAAIRFRAKKALDEATFQREFRRAFEFGCMRMAEIWEANGRDQARFVAELLKRTQDTALKAPGDELSEVGKAGGTPNAIVESEVKLKLLTGEEPWSMNGPSTKNGLLIISGQSGSGKSQLALDLLTQLSRQGVRFLFFDLKGELEEAGEDRQKAENREKFFDVTRAQYLRLIDNPLPINPLYAGKSSAETANIASRIAGLVRAFGPQMGPNQEDSIREAYKHLKKPDFPSLLQQLRDNGEKGVAVSLLNKLVDLNIFSSASKATAFENWIDRSNVVDLKPLDRDDRVLVAAFILNFFLERLNKNLSIRNGIQPIQMVLFVDEAHYILPKDSKAQILESLARQGRSWGFPLWLASQDADKFISSGVDFAKQASVGVHFSPQMLSPKEQKELLGTSISKPLEKYEAVLRRGNKSTTGGTRQFWRDLGV